MAKFDLKGLLNDRSVPDRQQDQKIVYRNPKDLIPSEENFYNTEKLERLKQSIKLLGILQEAALSMLSISASRKIPKDRAGHPERTTDRKSSTS